MDLESRQCLSFNTSHGLPLRDQATHCHQSLLQCSTLVVGNFKGNQKATNHCRDHWDLYFHNSPHFDLKLVLVMRSLIWYACQHMMSLRKPTFRKLPIRPQVPGKRFVCWQGRGGFVGSEGRASARRRSQKPAAQRMPRNGSALLRPRRRTGRTQRLTSSCAM